MRTGVTVIVPHAGIGAEPVFAGCHRLNGNGELTGLEWIRESGQLTTPVAITNTHSVGVVRDAIVAADMRGRDRSHRVLEPARRRRDLRRRAQRHQRHARSAPSTCSQPSTPRAAGPVAEGNVGGGTGMICHDFKGGTGTASRAGRSAGPSAPSCKPTTAGASGSRSTACRSAARSASRRCRRRGTRRRPSPRRQPGTGSIIVIAGHRRAAAAPPAASGSPNGPASASPGWAARRAFQRRHLPRLLDREPRHGRRATRATAPTATRRRVDAARRRDQHLFWGAIEATEEAILNALVAAETMVGRDGITAHRARPRQPGRHHDPVRPRAGALPIEGRLSRLEPGRAPATLDAHERRATVVALVGFVGGGPRGRPGAQAVPPVGQSPDVELLPGKRRAVVVRPPDRQARVESCVQLP